MSTKPQEIRGQTSQNGLEQELIAYLTFLQNIISRMNTNCMQCKIACIALTAGLMTAITAFKNEQIYILIFMIFIQFIFMLYDGMYLVFERHYREVYTNTIKSWQDGDLARKKIFCLQSPEIHLLSCKTFKAVLSSSIWPLYLLLAVFPAIILGLTRG